MNIPYTETNGISFTCRYCIALCYKCNKSSEFKLICFNAVIQLGYNFYLAIKMKLNVFLFLLKDRGLSTTVIEVLHTMYWVVF